MTAPLAAGPPPQVAAVSPAPRATFVLYDSTAIWAEFAAPLDSTSVSTLNVYLKVDTRRLPVAVSWEAARRRVHVAPLVVLDLNQTYTVELSPNLSTAGGTPLGQKYSWQFTTNSLRRPTSPAPASGASGESPFAPLKWGGNEAIAGSVSYEVFAGDDSAAVAERRVPLLTSGAAAIFVPRTRWTQDATTWWAVTVVNLATHEQLRGPAWRFSVLAASTPVDSVAAVSLFAGYAYLDNGRSRASCGADQFSCGPAMNTGARWDFGAFPPTAKLAGARLELRAYPGYEDTLAQATVTAWVALASWLCTQTAVGGVPLTDERNGRLATGTLVEPGHLRLESDELAAHLQATIRYATFYGYVLRASRAVRFASPIYPDVGLRPLLRLYFYRSGGPAPVAAAAGSRAGAAARVRMSPRVPNGAPAAPSSRGQISGGGRLRLDAAAPSR
ncbi:MAG: Ig-like domain-containing protein [Candidatus Eisenbacteria bacterium]|nr:Ig-like domain-containing protein [Candidatus Eisenbacteria bacterium]